MRRGAGHGLQTDGAAEPAAATTESEQRCRGSQPPLLTAHEVALWHPPLARRGEPRKAGAGHGEHEKLPGKFVLQGRGRWWMSGGRGESRSEETRFTGAQPYSYSSKQGMQGRHLVGRSLSLGRTRQILNRCRTATRGTAWPHEKHQSVSAAAAAAHTR